MRIRFSILWLAMMASVVTAGGATLSTNYTIGSGLMGTNLFVDNANTGGTDSAPAVAGDLGWAVEMTNLWSPGDVISLTGIALPIRNTTSAGTITFNVYELGGGTSPLTFNGIANETLAGSASATIASVATAAVYYVNFDSPIKFTATSSGIAVHFTNSTAALRVKIVSATTAPNALRKKTADGTPDGTGTATNSFRISLAGYRSSSPRRLNLAKFQSVTASSTNGQREPLYLTDGVAGNDSRWQSTNGGPHWATVQFPFPVQIGSAQVFMGVDEGSVPTNFSLQYFTNSTWQNVPGGVISNNTAVERNILFTSPVIASQFRIHDATDGEAQVKELALFAPNPNPASGVEQGYPLGTDVTLDLAKKRPAAATTNSAGNFPKLAVDGFVDEASKWQTTLAGSNALQIDLRVNTKIGSAHLYSGSAGVEPLADFVLRYWDGSAWADVPGGAVSGNTLAARPVTFSTPVTTSNLLLVFTNTSVTSIKELCVFPANGGGNYPLGQDVINAPPPAEQVETFNDAFYSITNTVSGRVMVESGGAPALGRSGAAGELAQYQILLNVGTDTYRLRNRSTGKCLSGAGLSTNIGALLADEEYGAMPHQAWRLVAADATNYFIVNQWSGLVVDTQGGGMADGTPLVQNTNGASATQRWQFNYLTHYPKKGLAMVGWSNINYKTEFQMSWHYNWHREEDAATAYPPEIVYHPMQRSNANWNLGDAEGPLAQLFPEWQRQGKAMHLLGFNEPDGAANLIPAADAIALWPRVEAMDLPLVSPSPTGGGYGLKNWMKYFYQSATNLGYRMDYSAAHKYTDPNSGSADNLIGLMQTNYTTFGRPVWLTEFSIVSWDWRGTWTEEDNYNCLAEFLWRVESLPWFRKYALFIFTADGLHPQPVNPWDPVGPRSNTFEADNVTLTPFGELYAAWDADVTVRTDKAYYIHNKACRKRLQNDVDSIAPSGRWIRDGGNTVQWTLRPSGVSNQWHVVSLRDGRLLRYSGGTVNFAPAQTAGTAVRWNWVEDQHGWFYLENPAATASARRLNNNAGVFSMVSNTSTNDQAKWRFVVPYHPVATAAPSAPTNLTATAGIMQIQLNWDASPAPDFSSYSVFRSTLSGTNYSLIASHLAAPTHLDTNVSAGTNYFYVVTATAITGYESTNSNQAAAIPAPTPVAPPSVPAGLSATGGVAQIVLNWPAAGGTAGYNLKRSVTSGGGYVTIASSIAGTTFTNTGLAGGTTYYYVVSATNHLGESANSIQAAAATIPSTPTGLTALAGNASAVLNWTAVAGAASYKVKRSATSGGSYAVIATGVTGTGYTNSGLINGATCYFVVSALNATGESADSAEASATPSGYLWDGSSSGNWDTGANWIGGNAPSNANTNDIAFYQSGALNLTNIFLGAAPRTNRSVNFTAAADANVRILLANTAAESAECVLAFDGGGAGASINIDSGAAGNIQIGNTLGSIRLKDDLTINHRGSGVLTLGRQITEAGGSRSLTKTGSGTLVLLSSASSYTGPTVISGGTLRLSGSGKLPASTALVLPDQSGAVFDLNGASQTVASLNGGGAAGGNISLGAGTLTISTANANDAYAGVISGPGSVVKSGSGTLTLSGANTYSGGTTAGTGVLQLGGDNVLGTGTLVFNGVGCISSSDHYAARTVTNAVRFSTGHDFGGNNELLTFTGPGDLTGARRTLQLYSEVVWSGSLSNGGIDKRGQTLTLSGVNTYDKETVIYSGALALVAGAGVRSPIPNSPAITIKSNTTLYVSQVVDGFMVVSNQSLAGSGTVIGNVTVAPAGVVIPGESNSVGTLSFDHSLALSNSVLVFDITSTNAADRIIVAGDLAPGGITTITLPDPTSLTNGYYTLIEVSGRLGGSAANFSVTSPSPSKTYSVAYQSGAPNKVLLQVSPPRLTWTGSSGAASNLWDINTTTNWINPLDGNAPEVFLNNDPVLFDNTGATNQTVNITTTVLPANVIINASSNYIFTGSGGIGGSGSLTKSGAGTLKLAGSNTYSGGTVISGGILQFSLNTSLGSGTVTINNGGALAGIGGGATGLTLTNTVVMTGGTAYFGISGITTSNLTFTGAVDLGGGMETLSVRGSANPALKGIVSHGGITFTGNSAYGNMLTLSGANTYDGGTILTNGGTLNINHAQALGTGTLTLSAGGNSPAVINNTSGAGITLANNNALNLKRTNITFSGTSDLDFGTGPVTLSTNVMITANGSKLTLGGVIGDGGNAWSLIKYGAGTLALSGANTCSGPTIINRGTLIGAADGALGSGNVTVAGGATLTLTNGVLNNYIHNSASLILSSNSILNLDYTGTDTIMNLSIDGTNLAAGTYTAANLVTAGLINAAGTGKLTVTGTLIYPLTGSVSGGNGTVLPASTNVNAGENATFVVAADSYYRISSLTANGASVGAFYNNSTATNFTWSNVQSTGALVATFTAQIAGDPAGTPYWWLAQYGLTAADSTNDTDLDGLKTWQEYIAGTDPTNSESCLKVTQATRNTATWSAVTGRVYSVYWSTNLVQGFTNLAGSIAYPQNSYTNTTPDAKVNHYQVKVQLQSDRFPSKP